MISSRHRLQFGLSACALAGVRMTPERRRLLELFAGQTCPVLLEEMVRHAAGASGAHPATVYRFVERLEGGGVVQRIPWQGLRGFKFSCDAGDILRCISCGLLQSIDPPQELLRWRQELQASSGYHLAHHWHEVSGVCLRCQNSPP